MITPSRIGARPSLVAGMPRVASASLSEGRFSHLAAAKTCYLDVAAHIGFHE